ncbi:MAG: cyclase [Micromonosporaceae bacterium]
MCGAFLAEEEQLSVFDSLAGDLLACRIVDLSSDVHVHEKGPFETHIDVVEATEGAQRFCDEVARRIVPQTAGVLRLEHFPGRAFLRHEMVTASVHAGSHIDAPGHYGPADDGSRGHINDAPLETFVGKGIMLDVTGISGWQVETHHVKAAAEAAGVHSYEQSIVLIHTEHDKAISAGIVEFLVNEGVRTIGTDADGFDGSFPANLHRFLESGDPATLWPAHMIGRRLPYYQIERLRNLELVPATGSIVVALPILIERATAAWTRAVAFVPDRADVSSGDEA